MDDSSLILRQLLADTESLLDYLRGLQPTPEKIRERLLLAERNIDFKRPDHFFTNLLDQALNQTSDLQGILYETLRRVTNEYLEINGSRVNVKPRMMDTWQGILPRIPALPLNVFVLFKRFGAPRAAWTDMLSYMKDYLQPNLSPTTLPSPNIPQLERLIRQHGLMELHMHLNGTTDPDRVWLFALENGNAFCDAFRNALGNPIVRQQFDQKEPGITEQELCKRLRLAACLREAMIRHLYGREELTGTKFDQLRNLNDMPDPQLLIPWYHPLSRIDPAFDSLSSAILEGMFHVHMLNCFSRPCEAVMVRAYHLYMLLWGYFNGFFVQQPEQFGFRQFEQFPNNNLRSGPEQEYRDRFFQLSGKSGRDLSYLEGRFSPKDSYEGNVALLQNIFSGYTEFQGYRTFDLSWNRELPHPKKMQLRLTAHFIKREESPTELGVRNQNLRTRLEREAGALLEVRRNFPLVQRYWTGIDAANNELYAAPEVFAPLYRRFRRAGFVNFTYHVGEDFVHLISGLRAIYEAVMFLDLKRGNRIGHATAVGIDPELWFSTMQPSIPITKQEWLDNLLFTRFILGQENNAGQEAPASIRDEIEKLAMEIYGELLPPYILWEAWKLRRLDPLIACFPERDTMESLDFLAREEWDGIELAKKHQSRAFDLFVRYHRADIVARGAEWTTADLLHDRRFHKEILQSMQTNLLKILHEREIVIESMPTSNVRISFYHSHKEHHLWRWLGIKEGLERDHLPAVCLATDDPGIFATNLRNEYAHVYETLTREFHLSANQAMEQIERLATNAKTYRFLEN
ncbi:MAG: hypothetical protein HQL96_05130 [Magnetococcales bacterium]|nr:hypothetical protein [Magnetococcales bacterium]